MNWNRKTIVASLMALFLLASVAAFGEKVKNKGVITLRNGDTLTVKTSEGDFTVTVNSDTKIQHGVGLTGVRKKQDTQDVLIPGLKMKFEGTGSGTQVAATEINFDSDDLALAQVIQAGLNPTAQQQARNMQNISASQQDIAANQAAIAATNQRLAATQQEVAANQNQINDVAASTKKRFSEMGEVVTKDQFTVLFETGDYGLSDEAKAGLMKIAKEAQAYPKGWALTVAGFADSVGTAASNQVLSKQRAQAVTAYLLQDCGIPVGRILAPGAMGESNPKASNESPNGRAENRRVDVTLVLNKGIAGQ